MNQRRTVIHNRICVRTLVVVMMLTLSGCSPLYLVNSLSQDNDSVTVLHQRYLEESGKPFGILRGMIGLAGPYGFNPMAYRSTRPIFAGVDVTDTAMPVSFACSATIPLLLFHGVNDSVVTPENSRELERRVDQCAGTVQYVELDDVGHYSIVLGLSDSFLAKDTIQTSIDTFLQSLSDQSG